MVSGESVVGLVDVAPIPSGDVRTQMVSIAAISRVENFLACGQSLAQPPILASCSVPFPLIF